MDSATQKSIINRMSRLIGHAESNKVMVENGAYCFDIINQNLAVISALHKANEALLKNHLETCVKKAMQSNDVQKQNEVIDEILQVYKKTK